MFQRFYPDEWCRSAYEIDYEQLYADGYRAILYDIDNTLVHHGAPADERSVGLFARLHKIGYGTCLISNNQKPRVAPFAEAVGTEYIENAHKPATAAYHKACSMLGVSEDQALLVGDQLFTDVWGAKRAGVRTILTQPIYPKEEIQIILKRRLEWIILAEYRRVMSRRGVRAFPKGRFQEQKKR